MPKLVEPLTPLDIENAKPRAREYKLSDGGGLYLLVTPSGGKLWRMNYRFDGKRKTLCLKCYPDRSLEEARTIHKEARQLLANAIDPLELHRQLATVEKLERRESQAAQRLAAVRVDIDGVIEIWKGKNAIRLTNDEAIFIKNQLCRLTE
ncbi:MAG TPA: DUF4102 domain-containing protein [Desulfuromonadales bacterium]|nr:DUF4102 domain-containing protein [Desulfuromonadales bacterium]